MSLPDKIDFKDISCVLLTSAKFKFRQTSPDKLIKALEEYFYLPKWEKESSYEEEFSKYKNIVFNKEFKIDSELKVKLGSFDFTVTFNSLQKRHSVDVYAFIYPVIEVVNLFYCISLEDMTVDELINFRKLVQFDKVNEGCLKLCNSGFMKKTNEFKYTDFGSLTKEIYGIFLKLSKHTKYKVHSMLSCLSLKKYRSFEEEYLKKLKHKSSEDYKNASRPKVSRKQRRFINHEYYKTQLFENINIEKLMLLEIRELADLEVNCTNEKKFIEKYSKKIYGLLVCDEGYNFVPRKTVMDAIDENFGSRNFFRVFTSNVGVLVFNFTNSKCRQNYNLFQQEIACCFDDNNSKILTQNPGIAGLEHGVLLAMEESINLLTIINSNMGKRYLSQNKKISKIIDNRRKLIDIINLISSINISEITNLKNLMLKKIGILAFVSRVRERLDIAENDTLVIYQRRNNFLVMVITILGVFFAAMSISEIKEIIIKFLSNL